MLKLKQLKEKKYKVQITSEYIEKNLMKAERDIQNGNVRDAKEVFEEWEKQYGI